MKVTTLALSLLAGIGAGCTSVPFAPPVSVADMPNCFDANYDKERGLFTMKDDVGNPVNQQCLLSVGARGNVALSQQLTAGSYRVYLSNGGDGGAGGTLQAFLGGGGGGGGGGAGAKEMQAVVNLAEGVYKLTMGAGGPGGSVCVPGLGFGGGPGWLGSPSSMIRVATGELVIGTPGADKFARPTRSQNDRMASKADALNTRMAGKADPGHGGSGPGQTSGGHGSTAATAKTDSVEATPGASKLASGHSEPGGATGTISVADKIAGVVGGGGGGGATTIGVGGSGGGESPGQKENPPQHGSLGSGGGGGEGSLSQCDPGARGGNGYIALRPI